MTANARMLTKCICTNCAGHLEFEEENAGETIPCPHCGFKTTLTLPGTERQELERMAWVRKQWRRRRLRQLAAALLVLAGLGFVLYHWGVPWVQDLWPALDSTPKAIIALIIGCLMLPFALAWLVFPVVLVFQLRHLILTLRPIVPGESEAGAESEVPTEIEVEPILEAPPVTEAAAQSKDTA